MTRTTAIVAVIVSWLALPQGSGAHAASFEQCVAGAVRQLDSDISADPGLSAVLAGMLVEEYGTPQAELRWALDRSISWGHIALLSYIQATTGRSFEALVSDRAHVEFAGFASRMELSPDKMAQSLEGFAARAVEERNSRIFDRLRSARRVDVMPDLGAGFGLFQEALDFRQLGVPRPTKVHSGPGFLAKGETGEGGVK